MFWIRETLKWAFNWVCLRSAPCVAEHARTGKQANCQEKKCMWSPRRKKTLTLSAGQKLIYVCLKWKCVFFFRHSHTITRSQIKFRSYIPASWWASDVIWLYIMWWTLSLVSIIVIQRGFKDECEWWSCFEVWGLCVCQCVSVWHCPFILPFTADLWACDNCFFPLHMEMFRNSQHLSAAHVTFYAGWCQMWGFLPMKKKENC